MGKEREEEVGLRKEELHVVVRVETIVSAARDCSRCESAKYRWWPSWYNAFAVFMDGTILYTRHLSRKKGSEWTRELLARRTAATDAQRPCKRKHVR